MKLMIASDIHGSALHCEAMLRAFDREAPALLLLLGDLLYHGPRNDLPDGYAPKAVAEMLNRYADRILCVRGNCEAEVDQMMLSFPVLSDSAVLFVEGRRFFASHGHIYKETNLPPLQEGDVFLSGHTHIPKAGAANGVVCLNPGSVSIPKNDTPHSYMIYEDGVFLWKTTQGETYMTYRL